MSTLVDPGSVPGLPTTGAHPESDMNFLTSADHHTLSPGDNVRVELDVEVFKMMQEGHGEWDDELLLVRWPFKHIYSVISSLMNIHRTSQMLVLFLRC